MDLAVNLLYPLDEFYDRAGLPLPAIVRVDGHAVPAPYHELLVHMRDMTPTLAAAFGCTLELEVMDREISGNAYTRQIVLKARGDRVLFGAIRIYLERFPDQAREMILAGVTPFGSVLQQSRILHSSSPIAFFRIEPDAVINAALGLSAPGELYGRRNVLRNEDGLPLAQVFEVLAPHTSEPPTSRETHS